MLVLTRKKKQGIMLGDNISITILEIGEDTIKIGIEAPKDVTILRSELYQAVKEENITAITSDHNAVDALKKIFANKG
ncbi:carbon storage regulator CsrA [Desulfoscipio gibsoniae]|uniref:Translational regulator CsrA n=1 Tax=Desulfoscipio gibsoniae DSM 7213 TaxID=767817 RepID=R4KES3_9FIRM|nr:carbon storage regulator CsrA [Desulfoscipio gibsoniae]AGL01698.1 carbon storage regulator CsrA [Desulfoscipio gibsoniae DSM 7213]